MQEQQFNLEIIQTADGSKTIVNKDLQATYHSKHGALQESLHIFILHGLIATQKQFGNHLHIFEVGFGTGLNALLTAIEAEKNNLHIQYTSIEKFPISIQIHHDLQHQKHFPPHNQKLVNSIIESEWNNWQKISENFKLKKIHVDFLYHTFDSNYHLIYFDAFAPDHHQEIWDKAIFERIYEAMHHNGILVTFCAKGSFKRMLRSIGFRVEAIAGPIGKREITKAIK